jgi:phytoene dehydrogenase-like protein
MLYFCIHVIRGYLCSMDEIDIAYGEALLGRASSRPLIEMTIPSVLDQTIAPSGLSCHSMP